MRAALWLMGLFAAAVALALFTGDNDGTVTIFWPPHRVDLSVNLVLLLLVGLFVLLHLALLLAQYFGQSQRIVLRAALAHALGDEGQHDGRQDLQQLARALTSQAGGLAQAQFGPVLLTAEDVAEDAGAIGLRRRSAAQHRAQHAAKVETGVVALQGAE